MDGGSGAPGSPANEVSAAEVLAPDSIGRETLAAPGEGVLGAALLSSVVDAPSFAAAVVLDASAPKREVNTVLNKGI